MPIFEKNNCKILYLHTPKTGGTSIAKHFVNCGWDVSYHNRLSNIVVEKNNNSLDHTFMQHADYELLTEYGVIDEEYDFIFMTCRHPFNRFVSGWCYNMPYLDYNHKRFGGEIEKGKIINFLEDEGRFSFDFFKRQIDFYGERVEFIKRQESGDWGKLYNSDAARFYKYMCIIHTPLKP